MNEAVFRAVEEAGWIAPLIFILLHVFRPILLLPVVVFYIAGGYLFGIFYGTLYTLIGLALMSAVFYAIVNVIPSARHYLSRVKRRVFGDRQMSLGQVNILRMMPFIHFQVLSLYLIEMTSSFKEYMRYSVAGVILPTITYTSFGGFITTMPWYATLTFFAVLAIIFFWFGQKDDPEEDELNRILAKAGF
ncbi:TVP38/TMEM64 family protein [Salisediminibacterium selenitireducens]|uniref:TVP38/TMEM64 family membrane protein n=1 Tax=Bacillus selenitireducens (strain ATCC 700615 / DSM 15326 / MLS10) TaxID=439292 RepID=D6XSV0_BACIE|nr:VTT domain-containing protein [Salisediminibacterium selenitireducens]ADH98886.1 SNARE associated Golgi protein-related protein [[Bacillus] selenitireducens MLS10]